MTNLTIKISEDKSRPPPQNLKFKPSTKHFTILAKHQTLVVSVVLMVVHFIFYVWADRTGYM